MGVLSQSQLVAVEQDNSYMNMLRMAVLAQASYWKSQTGVGLASTSAAEEWFRKRQTAENVLANPNVSIDKPYWSAKSLGELKNLDISGVVAETDVATIVAAITTGQWEQLAIYTFTDEANNKVKF